MAQESTQTISQGFTIKENVLNKLNFNYQLLGHYKVHAAITSHGMRGKYNNKILEILN